jgi:RNA polymerase sigma factor (sigma-70 family)
MNRDLAEKTVIEYSKKLYGFALGKTSDLRDAEDLAQEISLRLYTALLVSEIDNIAAFVWRIAHNALANYYRGRSRSGIGICIDDLADTLCGADDPLTDIAEAETVTRLHSEIARLSKLQRQIVILFYYEGKKQEDISNILSVPVGTVKWHLFEAKKDLKKGMETMKNLTELKFNPIHFVMCGTNGSIGAKGNNSNFFRSTLAQNIAYAVWKEGKTINEIADCLGVSPVFVESEAEYLAEYGFLLKQGNKYLCNILLDEATTEQTRLSSAMYEQAAKLFANALYDELTSSGILEDDSLYYPQHDRNFALWSLIPFIAARSGETLMEDTISFEDAATRRPDGGWNICYASVLDSGVEPPKYFDSVQQLYGPCWNGDQEKLILWMVDTEWSAKRADDNYHNAAKRDLSLFERLISGSSLTADEYAYMAERGYLKNQADADQTAEKSLQIVWVKNTETQKKLLSIGDKLKEKYKAQFDALKAPLVNSIMDGTPKQLQKAQAFGLQYIFYSDGWFLLHCLKELVNNGKLTLPTEEQKISLTTIITRN